MKNSEINFLQFFFSHFVLRIFNNEIFHLLYILCLCKFFPVLHKARNNNKTKLSFIMNHLQNVPVICYDWTSWMGGGGDISDGYGVGYHCWIIEDAMGGMG